MGVEIICEGAFFNNVYCTCTIITCSWLQTALEKLQFIIVQVHSFKMKSNPCNASWSNPHIDMLHIALSQSQQFFSCVVLLYAYYYLILYYVPFIIYVKKSKLHTESTKNENLHIVVHLFNLYVRRNSMTLPWGGRSINSLDCLQLTWA